MGWEGWRGPERTAKDRSTHCSVDARKDVPLALGARGQALSPLRAVFSTGLQMHRVYWVWEQEYLLSVGPPPQIVSDHVPCPLPGPDSITCPVSRGLSPPRLLANSLELQVTVKGSSDQGRLPPPCGSSPADHQPPASDSP